MSTVSKIAAAASRNKDLLSILSETDHARSELEQQDRYIADLQAQIDDSARKVDELDKKRQKEFKEHAKYRDSVVKRFAYKVTGKKDEFEAKASKEEREYFDALQEEHKAQELLKGLREAERDAQTARKEMVAQVQRHDQAQRDLDALYEEVFQGPSPGFPEEDTAEERRRKAGEDYGHARTRADAQGQAIRIMESAMGKMHMALRSMDDALRHSRRDMWGGGTFTDMMERNALNKASVASMEARVAVSQAMRFDHHIQMIPEINVPQGDILADMFFDNVFTDMMFHDKIKAGVAEMEHAKSILERQLGEARSRGGYFEGEVRKMQAALEKARFELQKVREREFERAAQGGGEVNESNGELASKNPFRTNGE